MTGPKDIALGLLILMIIGMGISITLMKSKTETLKTRIEVFEARERSWSEELADCAGEVLDLRAAIEAQNEAAGLRAELGVEAQRAQVRADALARRLALAEDQLDRMLREQQEFDALAVGADTCQTYELVLRSIVGEVP